MFYIVTGALVAALTYYNKCNIFLLRTISILFLTHNNVQTNRRPRSSRGYPAPRSKSDGRRKSVEEPASRAAAGSRLGPEAGRIYRAQGRDYTGLSSTEAARGTVVVVVVVAFHTLGD